MKGLVRVACNNLTLYFSIISSSKVSGMSVKFAFTEFTKLPLIIIINYYAS